MCETEKQKTKRKKEPAANPEKKAKILSLYRQGNVMRMIADQEHLAVSTVHRIISEEAKKTRVVYVYADREKPATIIDACNLTEKVKVVNVTDNMISRAFGVKEKPDWNDYEYFLESRCMPRTRFGIREELNYMGIDFYDPFLILQKTGGRVYGDHQYLRRMGKTWIQEFDEIMKQTKKDLNRREKLLDFLHKTEKEWKLNESEY